MQISEDFRSLLLTFKDKLNSLPYVEYKELLTSGCGGQVFVHIESDSDDDYEAKNAELLSFFAKHPLVRKVTAALSLASFTAAEGVGLDVAVTSPDDIASDPVVGVIDNGIPDVFVYTWSELQDAFGVARRIQS